MLEGKPIDVSELREEVPFAMDSSFAYRGSESGFKRYCDNEKKIQDLFSVGEHTLASMVIGSQ